MPLPIRSLQAFWSAVLFIRRAPQRDHASAIKVLAHISRTKAGKIKARADSLLNDISRQRQERRRLHYTRKKLSQIAAIKAAPRLQSLPVL